MCTLPYFNDNHRDLDNVDVAKFPRLADAMSVLDATFSSRYPNSLMPLVVAHGQAAIASRMGGRVMSGLARKIESQNPSITYTSKVNYGV